MQIKEEWRATPSGLLRARGLGLALGGQPGPFNAITDVANVEVGYDADQGSGPLVRGSGPVRTGVTAILPRGRGRAQLACAAGGFSLNGNGEMTGMIWVEDRASARADRHHQHPFSRLGPRCPGEVECAVVSIDGPALGAAGGRRDL